MPKRPYAGTKAVSVKKARAMAAVTKKFARVPRQSLTKLMFPELKISDNNAGGSGLQTIAAGCTFFRMSAVAEGDDFTNRDGRKIFAKNLSVRYRLLNPTGNPVNAARVVIFRDASTNGTAPTGAQLFQNGSSSVESAFNASNRNRFRILYDKYIPIISNVLGTTSLSADVIYLDLAKKFPDDVTTYIGTGSTDADLGTNQYWMCVYLDGGITGAPTGTNTATAGFAMYSRFQFSE